MSVAHRILVRFVARPACAVAAVACVGACDGREPSRHAAGEGGEGASVHAGASSGEGRGAESVVVTTATLSGDDVLERAMAACSIDETHCGAQGCLGPLDDAERYARVGGLAQLVDATVAARGQRRAVGLYLVNGVITRMRADGTMADHVTEGIRATLEAELARAEPCSTPLLLPLFMAGGPLGPPR